MQASNLLNVSANLCFLAPDDGRKEGYDVSNRYLLSYYYCLLLADDMLHDAKDETNVCFLACCARKYLLSRLRYNVTSLVYVWLRRMNKWLS